MERRGPGRTAARHPRHAHGNKHLPGSVRGFAPSGACAGFKKPCGTHECRGPAARAQHRGRRRRSGPGSAAPHPRCTALGLRQPGPVLAQRPCIPGHGNRRGARGTYAFVRRLHQQRAGCGRRVVRHDHHPARHHAAHPGRACSDRAAKTSGTHRIPAHGRTQPCSDLAAQ